MKTNITKYDLDWKKVKNKCRHTSNKQDTDNDATKKFKRNLLLAEHSPLRLLEFEWSWDDIKYWIVGHFVRHHIGVEKFVSTQRTDRTGVNRDELPQDNLVNLDMKANVQALINMAKVRLCHQASKETREYMEDLKESIGQIDEDIAWALVPQCVYRGGCNEFIPCGLYKRFERYLIDTANIYKVDNIQERYDLYNEFVEYEKTNGIYKPRFDEGAYE